MKLFTSTSDAKSFFKKGAAIAIGNYDGVHLGHRVILNELKKTAKKNNLKTGLLSFEPHPAKVLSPQTTLQLINTREQKIELLKNTGLDALILQSFNKRFAVISPKTFFEKHIVSLLNSKMVFVGHDFTFGDKRSGTIETLEILGFQHNVTTHIVPAQLFKNTLVSSSLVRKLVREGDIALANQLLTREFFIDGEVIHGQHRGTALGIHTANVNTANELIPWDGVYATRTCLNGKTYNSVTNIGLNPTFDNTTRTIETHILNFDSDIYHKKIRVCFVERIRDEIRFATPTALIKQIEKDIARASMVLQK